MFELDELLAMDDLPCLDGRPMGLAVIGDPVGHSLSPRLHQRALDAAGRGLAYGAVRVPQGRVPQAFGCFQRLGMVGVNVTVPHKLAALEACEEVTPHARLLGAVNTVSFGEGKVRGANSDGPGMLAALEEDFGLDVAGLRGASVVVVGAGGGAGRAAAVQLALTGVERLVLVNRTREKVEQLGRMIVDELGQQEMVVPALEVVELGNARGLERVLAGADLMINATSVGLGSADEVVVDARLLRADLAVMDMVYRGGDTGGTALVRAADACGARWADGMGLLLHQGAISQRLWFGQMPDLELMRAGLFG